MLGTIELSGKTWFHYSEFGHDFWVRNETDGQHEILFDEKDGKKEIREQFLFMPYPARIGATQEIKYSTIRLMSTDSEVTTPAGKLECFHYQIEDARDFVISNYVSPGVGVVKHVFNERSLGRKVYEMKSFKLMDDEDASDTDKEETESRGE